MSDSSLTRREFAGRFAVTAGAAAGMVTACTADQAPDKPDQPETPPPPSPEEFLLGWLLSEYPAEHLTEETLAGIRGDIRGNLAQARRLRSYPLENSDGPATLYRAWRKE